MTEKETYRTITELLKQSEHLVYQAYETAVKEQLPDKVIDSVGLCYLQIKQLQI